MMANESPMFNVFKMDLNENLVRRAGFFVIASSFLYQIIRSAKMYEVHRVDTSNSTLGPASTALTRDRLKISLGISSVEHPFRSIRRSNVIDRPEEEGVAPANILERRSNLPSCAKSMKLYYRLVCAYHILLAIKYLTLCALDMGTLAHKEFGYIDCLLAGRTTLNPRVVGLCKYSSMCVFCFHSAHNLVLLNRRSPFRLHCLEFLLVSPETIERFSRSSDVMCCLLSYRSPPSDTSMGHVRPNRTVRAWRRLATCATLWVGTVVGTYVVLIPLIWFYVLPMIVTRPGFEINYKLCIGWIAQQDSSSRWRRLIYELPANYTGPDERWHQKFSVPLSEPWVEMNAYQIVRIVWEIMENFVGQLQVWIAYSVITSIAVLISLDTCYYCRQIEIEIMSIIREQRESHKKYASSNGVQSSERRRRSLPLRRIDNVQTMVLDLFALIRDYNSYTVQYVCLIISIWYLYSFICSSWLFMPYDRYQASTLESKLIQVAATALILVIMGSYASARVACRQLYKSISTIMTLQDMDATSRKRWLIILKHYTPTPLYCFSLFKTTELSWMFALKLTAWLFSALLILSSFAVGGPRLSLAHLDKAQ